MSTSLIDSTKNNSTNDAPWDLKVQGQGEDDGIIDLDLVIEYDQDELWYELQCEQQDEPQGEPQYASLADLLGVEPETLQGASDAAAASPEEAPTLMETIDQAKQSLGSLPAKGVAANSLLGTHAQELSELAAGFSRLAVLCGVGGADGFVNPASTLASDVRKGKYDEVPMADYEVVLGQVNEAASLWEGMRTMQGITLARNLLLHMVLQDDALRNVALGRAKDWMTTTRTVIEQHGGKVGC